MERREHLKETINNLHTIITLNGVSLSDLIYLFYNKGKLSELQFYKINRILDGTE